VSDPVIFSNNQLLRRLLDPDEVAATIAFCCSVEGAALNGSVVHADGGFRP
jgi:NAD(P)-dependent dehydrogenase (short-subunit alcohol dehydrogenase family)